MVYQSINKNEKQLMKNKIEVIILILFYKVINKKQLEINILENVVTK